MTAPAGHRTTRATALFFRSPRCSVCRSMEPDLDAVMRSYADTVELVPVDVARDADWGHRYGVRGTPTLIVLDDGGEIMYRHTGRLTRIELDELFDQVTQGSPPTRSPGRDARIRVAAGLILAGLGLVSGPAWPLVAIGLVIAGVGYFVGRSSV